MTLRHRLGGDVDTLFEQINTLLDNEDALIVFFDGRRMVSYTHGFAASPSQLELLGLELERSVRGAVGQSSNRRDRKNREEGNTITDRGDRAGIRERLRGADGRGDRRVADIGGQSPGPGHTAHDDRRHAPGRVLRLARESA